MSKRVGGLKFSPPKESYWEGNNARRKNLLSTGVRGREQASAGDRSVKCTRVRVIKN